MFARFSRWSLLVFLLGSCSLGAGSLQVRESAELKRRVFRRLAVLPLELSPRVVARRERDLPGSAPGPVTDPAPILTRYLLNVMKGLAGWSLVPKKDVQEAMVVWGSAQADSRANKVGARVNADAVLYGRIFRYQERVGAAGWGAKSPASVAFALYLMDVRGETIVWQARFQETQRPLSENIFALGEFVLRGAKWLTAEELALAGIKKAVQRLQQALYPRGVNSIYPFDGNGSIPAGESVSKGRSSSP